MACLPRFMRANSKKSFTPAVDENTETLLNNSHPVQIGRYIRREESPLFTPKNSNKTQTREQLKAPSTTNNNIDELIRQSLTLPRQKQPEERENFHTNSKPKSFTTENNNNEIVMSKSISNTNKQSTGKKFISNRNSNNINTSNQVLNHTQALKSAVKQRRPTALPAEVPKIQDYDTIDDDADATETVHSSSDEVDNFSDLSYPRSPSSPTTQNVRFFIGRGEDDDTSSMNTSLGCDKTSLQANGSVLNAPFSNNRFSITKLSSVTTTISSKTIPKVSSYSNNKTRKRPPRSSAARNSLDELKNLNIPAPPPLPPQILTTAESTTSLASIRSANAKRHTNANKIAQMHSSRSDGDCNFAPKDELLNDNTSLMLTYSTFQKMSIASGSAEPMKSTGNSANGCDSGVEDTSSTPKDSDVSDSPTSHRIEGGLIYTRANVPVKKDVEFEYIRKDEPTRDLIRSAIETNDFLNNYMDKERKEMVIDAMSPAFYDKDAFIIHENDEGSEIFVSEDGYFDVIKNEKLIGSFGPATVFGELAILYNAKRFASVRAATYARVWKIDRDTFRRIMIISGSRERQENLNFLKSAPFLKDLSEEMLDKVVDLLQRKFYETNTCIVREGEVGNEFFIIRGGTVTIKKKNAEGLERVVARRKRGEYFGEQALVNADFRQASVYADAPGTEVLKLDREAFHSYLGTIPQLREKPISVDVQDGRENNRQSEFDNEYAQIHLTDLKKVATLGAGAFGRVDLVAYEEKTFALKIIKKIDIVKQDQVEHVYSEKYVMMKCRKSPFIIELYKTFRNEKFVYFLMEACMGGDVWTVMSQRRFFDEKTARFIAGCVVEAFDFLHSHNIIYRDLKPENLMLTTDGYCKLVDFGFAKHIPPNQKTNTFAGTPEYVAPEIILDRGHDRAVDYWALGILIFELLVGKTPFREQNQIKIYQKILGGIDVIQMPSKIPKSAHGLIKSLCKQLPAERLGYQRKGIQDIKKHSWFDSLDWNRLKNKLVPSPIRRPITSNTDLQYFGPSGVENDHDPPDETSGWDMDF